MCRFNREFRTPFKEILLLRCRGINSRLRTETYAEQFGLMLPSAARRRPPAGTSVVAMAAAAAVHTVVQYQDALRRTSVRLSRDATSENGGDQSDDTKSNGAGAGCDGANRPTEV